MRKHSECSTRTEKHYPRTSAFNFSNISYVNIILKNAANRYKINQCILKKKISQQNCKSRTTNFKINILFHWPHEMIL